jgi:hypothetical protein
MSNTEWFVIQPELAQAYGRPEAEGFLVRKGSTAMRNGSPKKKRNRVERDRLVNQKILKPETNPELYRFSSDHLFSSPSAAGGVVRDGNCSGPQSWRRTTDNKTLKELR